MLANTLRERELALIKQVTTIIKKSEDGVASDSGAIGISGSIKNRDLFLVTRSLLFGDCYQDKTMHSLREVSRNFVLLDMGAGIGKALMAAWAFWNV